MNHIPTTATVVQKLKRVAKTRRKSSGQSLAAALNAVALEHGYRDWKHVTVCEQTTAAAKPATMALPTPLNFPTVVSDFLLKQQGSRPPAYETIQAMASGLVFAIDTKDAENVRPESNPEIRECEDAVPFLADKMWLAALRVRQEESVGNASDTEPDEQLQDFLDFIADYRFFRYSGPLRFATLDDVFAGPLRSFFFPPTHIWLNSVFYDMGNVPEIRVDGRVVYSTTLVGGNRAKVYTQATQAPANPRREDVVIARLDVRKLQPSLYEFQVSHGGVEVFSDAGFSSIADALRTASEVTGAIRAYEVAYAGLVAGTYPVEELAATAEAVAQRAVDLAASLGRF